MLYAQSLIAAKAARAHAADKATWGPKFGLQVSLRSEFRSASRRVRIRQSGHAAKVWIRGYGENTPLTAIFPPAA